jgi:DNA-directed RNA polymerase specialized sigma24 family protein
MELEALLRRTVGNDVDAWRELLEQVTPSIQAITRSHEAMRGRGLADRSDDLSEVTLAVIGRLARDDYKNLKRYLAQCEGEQPQSFDSWLYGTVDFAIRDHLRKRFGRAPKLVAAPTRPLPSKRDLNTQAEEFDEGLMRVSIQRSLGVTTALDLAHILAYVAAHFSGDEVRALQLHYAEDKSLAEIAAALGLPDEASAQKLLRRLTARLRHRFAKRE